VYGDLVSCCTVDNSLSSSVWQFCMNRMVTKIELLIVFACIAFTSGKITVLHIRKTFQSEV